MLSRCGLSTVSVLVLGLAIVAHADPLPDGLYARFSTSMGDFTCRLDYTGTPRTVANFVQLAEGDRVWGVDEATGTIVSNACYDGGLVHRIVSNRFIQAGNPVSPASADIGFRLADEFTTPSSTNVAAGSLAMANAGPDTNGTGFFVTVDDEPDFDGRYTVFGHVVEGADVVEAISLVPALWHGWRPEYSVPTIDIILHGITILRVGTAAQAWDPQAVSPPLPEPEFVRTTMINMDGTLVIIWGDQGGAKVYSFSALDLVNPGGVGLFDGTPYTGSTLAGYQDVIPYSVFWTIVRGTD